ncbi:hypothetical protein NORO109296_17685 [Nocardiopsis rhodophaea]
MAMKADPSELRAAAVATMATSPRRAQRPEHPERPVLRADLIDRVITQARSPLDGLLHLTRTVRTCRR